jgi:hypothetical protein
MRLFYAFLFAGITQLFHPNWLKAQSWQSIHKSQTGNTVAWKQFVINPYTNDIWLVNDNKAAVIKNDGAIQQFTSAELGPLWNGSNLQFAFTPTDIYFAVNLYGLFKFTGFTSISVNSTIPDYLYLQSNADTIFVTTGFPNGFVKYSQGNNEIVNRFYTKINAKNNFFYGHDGSSVIYQFDQQTNSQLNLTADPNYLQGVFHDTKFSRFSDTLYIGGVKGISFAYNYDILDTITPNNTSNMPSSNVLEIEFDHLDQLWAVFGDAADVPFAIAKLEANNWINRIDASNSPINFSEFLGLEIDTIGNLWVADNLYIHTLLTANSPGWLGLTSNNPLVEIDIIPNPSNGIFQVSSISTEPMQITILDQQGKQVAQFELNKLSSDNSFDLSNQAPGVYFAQITQGELHWVKKLVLR